MLPFFSEYRFLYPARPSLNVPRSALADYEAAGWHANHKKNGTCNVIGVAPGNKALLTRTRHGERHRQWKPSPASSARLRAVPANDGWTILVAELLHNKLAGGPRDTNFVNDILVDNGEYLVGVSYAERQTRLARIFPVAGCRETESYFEIDPQLWLAKVHRRGFAEIYDSLDPRRDEGLVLKNPAAPLELCCRPMANSRWIVKALKSA